MFVKNARKILKNVTIFSKNLLSIEIDFISLFSFCLSWDRPIWLNLKSPRVHCSTAVLCTQTVNLSWLNEIASLLASFHHQMKYVFDANLIGEIAIWINQKWIRLYLLIFYVYFFSWLHINFHSSLVNFVFSVKWKITHFWFITVEFYLRKYFVWFTKNEIFHTNQKRITRFIPVKLEIISKRKSTRAKTMWKFLCTCLFLIAT